MKYVIIICLIFSTSDLFSTHNHKSEQPLEVVLESTGDHLGINFVIQVSSQSSVVLRIRDRSRDIVFQKSFHGSKAYKGMLNLESLSDGQYFLEVRHSGQKFTQKVNLRKYSQRTVHLH